MKPIRTASRHHTRRRPCRLESCRLDHGRMVCSWHEREVLTRAANVGSLRYSRPDASALITGDPVAEVRIGD
jgi:hypothetical protein